MNDGRLPIPALRPSAPRGGRPAMSLALLLVTALGSEPARASLDPAALREAEAARRLAVGGDLDGARARWDALLRRFGGGHSVRVATPCEGLREALISRRDLAPLWVRTNADGCHEVLWGHFASQGAAEAAASRIPARLVEGAPGVVRLEAPLGPAPTSVAEARPVPASAPTLAAETKPPEITRPEANVDGLLRQGNTAYVEGDLRGALEAFEAALALDSNNPRVLNNLSSTWLMMGDETRAVQMAERALAIDPTYARAELNLGTALYALDRVPEARPHLERAVHLDPRSVDARYNLAALLVDLRDWQEAERVLEEATRLAPGDSRLQGQLEQVRARRRAAEDVPVEPPAPPEREPPARAPVPAPPPARRPELVQERVPVPEPRTEPAPQVIVEEPRPHAPEAAPQAPAEAPQQPLPPTPRVEPVAPPAAAEPARPAVVPAPGEPIVARRATPDEAPRVEPPSPAPEPAPERETRVEPQPPREIPGRPATGSPAVAASSGLEGPCAKPLSRGARARLASQFFHDGRAAYARGDMAAAEAVLERAFECDPTSAVILNDLGAARLQAGRAAAAESAFALALEFDPEFLEAAVNHALALLDQGRCGDACSRLGGLASRRPDSGEAAYQLARALHRCGRSDEARKALTKAEELLPEDPRPARLRQRLEGLAAEP